MIGSWKRAAAASALCLSLAAVATAGVAQDRPPGPGGPADQQHGPGQHGPDRQKIFEEMRQRREQRLHDLLQIKPDQEGAFHAFLTAVQPPHRDDQHGPRGPGAAPITTPQRLDRITARIARQQAVIAATRNFYAALSPDQRKAFDALPREGRGHRGGHGHHGHEGGGRHFEGQR